MWPKVCGHSHQHSLLLFALVFSCFPVLFSVGFSKWTQMYSDVLENTHSHPQTTSAGSFIVKGQRLLFLLRLDVWAPRWISKVQHLHPLKENLFSASTDSFYETLRSRATAGTWISQFGAECSSSFVYFVHESSSNKKMIFPFCCEKIWLCCTELS